MLDGPAFLNVAHSATGRRWVGPGPEAERQALAIAQATGCAEILARVLAIRGVAPDTAEAHLAPTLRALMPDPSTLCDMDAAADRLADAVTRGERVALFGDYDVDGAASVALVSDWLGAFGMRPEIHIPDRIAEGYGPNAPAMRALARRNGLILCLDCGTATPEPIAAARGLGAEVIVVDHHLAPGALPETAAVVNPNRPDCRAGLGYLAAAGVAFLLLVATNRTLRRRGLFRRRPEPDLRERLDLVALATVADVVPLTGLNRALVRQGLGVLARRTRPGLVALADVAGLSAPPTARDLGFALAPRINAGGRIGASDLGTRLLTARDATEAERLALDLDALNAERKAIEAAVLDAALAQIEARGPEALEGPMVWAAGEGWHPGVLGIVAARLKDRFNRPAVCIGLDGGESRGSARSVEGVDMGAAMAALMRDGLLSKGGGHAMAAGLSVAAERVPAAMDALAERLARRGPPPAGARDLAIDGALTPGGAGLEIVRAVEAAGPFGQANPAPRFAFPEVRIARAARMGEGHLRLRAADATGRGAVDAVLFGAAALGLVARIEAAAATSAPVHLAGRLEIDDWGGRRRAKLFVDDIAFL
ncbi:MAG: single-stranded-DNA-specific exonuclease RecJ [Paracoccaceae bacterium]